VRLKLFKKQKQPDGLLLRQTEKPKVQQAATLEIILLHRYAKSKTF
jgi:hypothetical protein